MNECRSVPILGGVGPGRQGGSGAVFVIWAAWLYAIGMLALGAHDAMRGVAVFVVFGIAPVLFMVWVAALRVRSLRASMRDE
ncbi:MAG: hypothetical protein IT532_17445 [Burkholderiales bacterium]|nr:hypothetical protein [Burkholderiales bacterium]